MVAYEGKEPYVFISYAHSDRGTVLPIIEGLQGRNFRVWYDEGVEVGNEWPDFIAEHIENCCGMVAFVSRNFGESNNCREELGFAKELEKTILVIYLEDRKKLRAGVRMRLSTLHYMNLADYADNGVFLNELAKAKALKPCLGTAPTPARTPAPAPARTPAPAPTKPARPDAAELTKQGEAYYDRKEYEKAVPLLKKAAEMGNARGQHRLGVCYWLGHGVQTDDKEAVKWFSKAADQGYVSAQYHLGHCYQMGYGVQVDHKEARKWYQKAADQGYDPAKEKLNKL